MAYNPYNPFSWNAQNNPAYNFGQGLYNFTHAPFNETFQKGVDTHIGNVNQTNTRANQLLKEIQGDQTQNTGSNFSLFSHANAAIPTDAERAAMLAGNNSGIMGAYRPNMRDISGEVGEYGNIGDIRLNEMERIIADNEFKEQPGIHFDNAPIENIFKRQNDPTKGFIDRNFRYRDLNKPEGAVAHQRGFSFPNFGLSGILKGLKNQFQRPKEKQAAYEAIMGDRKPLGLWNTQSGNYGGNKYTLQRSPTGLKVYSEVNPYGKNFDSAFGSKSLEEMDEKTLAWAMDRLSKGKNISSRLTGILENRGRLDGTGGSGDGGGATRWQPDYEGAVAHQQQMAAKAGQTHEQFMSDLNEVRAKGGRVGYNEGGRVGILSVF